MKEGKNQTIYIDKLVGIPRGLTEEVKEGIQARAAEDPEDRTFLRDIEGIEIAKNPRDIELINFVDSHVDKFLSSYGREKVIPMPVDRIHLLKEGSVEELTEGSITSGMYVPRRHRIFMDEPKSEVEFCITTFHEMIHAKSYRASQVIFSEGEDGFMDYRIAVYRSGLKSTSRDDKELHLGSVEEAIVGFLTFQFFELVIEKDPQFKEELERMRANDEPVGLTRLDEFKSLINIVGQIFEKNSDRIKSQKEVLDMFIDAQINGNLIGIGRLIEKTFGKGSLKKFDVKYIP